MRSINKDMISEKRGNVFHGVLLIALFSFSACYLASSSWAKSLSFSPLIIGIIIGMIYANSLRNFIPNTWVPGIKFCSKRVLRLGIVLYGFRLTFQQVQQIGLPAITIDIIIICGTLLLGRLIGKLLKMDSDTALITSTGSAICGAAAVLGAEPVIKCEPYKTTIAVTTVVIFGTLSMFLYPIMYRMGWLDLSAQQMAVYTGSTLHEVAHVVGASNAMDTTGFLHLADQATITKMIRVMLLAPTLVIMGFVLSRNKKAKKRKITIPWFAFWFIAVIALNTILVIILPSSFWNASKDAINGFDNFLLTMAMTALGTETNFGKFKQAGAKPFILAAILYVWLVVGGYNLCKFIVP